MTPTGLTFPEMLQQHAAKRPSFEALRAVHFASGEVFATGRCFAWVWEAVSRAGSRLRELGVRRGDRILLAVSEPSAFLAYFAGAQCLGAIPVPCPSLSELQSRAYVARIAGVANDARPVAAVVDGERAVEALPEEVRRLVRTHVVSAAAHLADGSGAEPDFRPICGPDDVAFIQYTSGSTGSPKGVVVLHRNVSANVEAIARGGEMGQDDVVFSWLPLFHDMGLVAGLLLGLHLGIPTYVASPRVFAARPDAWLRAITRFGATFSAAPNFAFHALAHRIPERALRGVDLGSWRLAFDGAESVAHGTCTAFIERFAAYGFHAEALRPAYGLAEATLAVAFPQHAATPRFDHVDRERLARDGMAVPVPPEALAATAHTSVGSAVVDHALRIVDPVSGCDLPERHVGEIVVTGPSVTPGYFDELSAGAAPRTELRTGDLGYLAGGELYVVDRIKDVLVIAGRKFAPSDIERVVGEIPGVRGGAVAAFSVRGNDGTEELSLVVGLDGSGLSRRPEVCEAVQRRLYDHFGLTARHLFPVRPGDLPKTSSGKLQRSRCRDLFATGDWQRAAAH